ncbi:RNA polymerase sigma factor [Crocinitomix algicola]|uniref:RNA polymerase sigma factor n=1 Tax=Crocinitomix algicola TaxID=1740263 RepID=UPI0008322BD3|nr:sigma-70 family RNA polymerase sigma factor [Crocinitomix algicola]
MKVSPEILKDDQRLVELAKRDRNAFALIYEKYFERIYLFVYKRVQDEAKAGDICQEAMLKAMFNIHKYENRGAPFSSWLYRIASNEANLYFRKLKKEVKIEVSEKDIQVMMREVSINDVDNMNEQEKLVKALNNLTPEQAEIIDLRFFMHYSFKAIADFYSITEASAKMRVYRILEKLKKGWTSK